MPVVCDANGHLGGITLPDASFLVVAVGDMILQTTFGPFLGHCFGVCLKLLKHRLGLLRQTPSHCPQRLASEKIRMLRDESVSFHSSASRWPAHCVLLYQERGLLTNPHRPPPQTTRISTLHVCFGGGL